MPYASKAQARAMHAKAERGEISEGTVHEFDEATKRKKGGFRHLPESKHMAEKMTKGVEQGHHGLNSGDMKTTCEAEGSHENTRHNKQTRAINTGHPKELERFHKSDENNH